LLNIAVAWLLTIKLDTLRKTYFCVLMAVGKLNGALTVPPLRKTNLAITFEDVGYIRKRHDEK